MHIALVSPLLYTTPENRCLGTAYSLSENLCVQSKQQHSALLGLGEENGFWGWWEGREEGEESEAQKVEKRGDNYTPLLQGSSSERLLASF